MNQILKMEHILKAHNLKNLKEAIPKKQQEHVD